MDQSSFLNTPFFTWAVLPLLIFTARIVDVSLGTIRVIFVSRGLKYLAPVIGFFEILIWLLAIGQIFQNLDNMLCYLAYAAGFASGNFLGIYIVDRLSIGKVIVRVVTPRAAASLAAELRKLDFGVTAVEAQGAEGKVSVLFSVISRPDLDRFVAVLQRCTPRAFYSVEDVRYVNEGVFPRGRSLLSLERLLLLRPHRKAK